MHTTGYAMLSDCVYCNAKCDGYTVNVHYQSNSDKLNLTRCNVIYTPSPNLDPNDSRPIDSFILLIHNFIYHSAAWGSDALVCLDTWCTLIII